MALSVTVHKLDFVLFPGDAFRCIVEFKNNAQATGDAEKDHQNIQPLAWASAQVYGQYVTDSSLIALPAATEQRAVAGSTLPKLGTRPFLLAHSEQNLNVRFRPSSPNLTLLSPQKRTAGSCILAEQRLFCAI